MEPREGMAAGHLEHWGGGIWRCVCVGGGRQGVSSRPSRGRGHLSRALKSESSITQTFTPRCQVSVQRLMTPRASGASGAVASWSRTGDPRTCLAPTGQIDKCAFHCCSNPIIILFIFHAAISRETNNLLLSFAVKRRTNDGGQIRQKF